MKELELLQNEETGIRYIKSYPILKKLNLSPLKIDIIQLILSYQSNNQKFYMDYGKIADILSSTRNSITKNISELNVSNYIETIHSSNFNGKNGGSSTTIKVNMDYILQLLTPNIKPNEVKTKNDTNIPQEEIKVVTEEKIELEQEYKITIAYDAVVVVNKNDYDLIMSDEELKNKVLNSNNKQGVEYWLKLYKSKKIKV